MVIIIVLEDDGVLVLTNTTYANKS